MPIAFPSSRTHRRPPGPARRAAAVITTLVLAAPAVMERPARAGATMGAIVRAFCLSAFENEMSRAGRTPPKGMASFACDCVEERIRAGGTIDSARSDCRQATAHRYPL